MPKPGAKCQPRSSSRSAEPAGFPPLPPPRKNKPLLIAAAALVVFWIAFLLCLALHVFGR
jgi:hypothetical protein